METLSQEQLDKYQRDGYLVIDTGINHALMDGIVRDLEPVWGDATIKELPVVMDNRIQNAWLINQSVKDVALYQPVLDVLQQLYQKKPLPFQTLNFRRGTQQRVHSDSLHFNSEPFGMMCGVWVALEDIGENQGPLFFYPGSQQLPEMNFPDMQLPVGDYHNSQGYLENLLAEKDMQPTYGTIKKGQAIIWAANLLHGGSKQNDPALSRHSQVSHYYFEDSKYWRPGASETERHYFEPHWIPLPEKPTHVLGRLFNKLWNR